MEEKLYGFFAERDFGEGTAGIFAGLITALVIIVAASVIYFVAKYVVLKIIRHFAEKSKIGFISAAVNFKILDRLVLIIPALAIYTAASLSVYSGEFLRRLAVCLIVFSAVRSLDRLLDAGEARYKKTAASKTKPIKGIIQIIKIFVYIIAAVAIISVIVNKSPLLLIGGIGAASAVLMLIFQNTILGFVASIQLTENDMLRIDDWIEMPKYNADGDVVEISVNTVKVVNWDKTITTIPTHAMITDSFKNWRNMTEIGGRRIKRSVHIDMNSVKFCDERMVAKFEKIQYISEYIKSKEQEISEYNRENNIDGSSLVNGRHLTNIGTFRAYLEAYIKNNPRLNHGLISLVRQLEPTEHGIPIEIYVFTKSTKWIEYEKAQADLFDHILAVVPEFELRIFQSPGGADLQRLR